MTDTTLIPLTEADVRALGYTPFGYERDDRMGSVLAHKDGEAFYLCRRGAFWSIDPEYSNMRNVLCEVPPNWRQFRAGCLIYWSHTWEDEIGQQDVLVWRVSDLPAERAERLGNHHTIAPVLAGLKAQAEADARRAYDDARRVEPPVGNGIEHESVPEPAYRNPLKVGDPVCYTLLGTNDGVDGTVEATRAVLSGWEASRQCYVGGKWHWESALFLILPDAEG